jgi:hypothetical protein
MPPKKPFTPKTPAPAAKPTPVAPVPAAPIERSETKGSGAVTKPKAAPRTITHDMISQRAYEIYASRGYAAGDQNADWIEAERQLKAGL